MVEEYSVPVEEEQKSSENRSRPNRPFGDRNCKILEKKKTFPQEIQMGESSTDMMKISTLRRRPLTQYRRCQKRGRLHMECRADEPTCACADSHHHSEVTKKSGKGKPATCRKKAFGLQLPGSPPNMEKNDQGGYKPERS